MEVFVVDPIENLEEGTRSKPFAMICHPKTGSQSMQKCLRSEFNARVVRGMHAFDQTECERIIGEGGIVACTVRNPWDLLLSWYYYSEHGPKYNTPAAKIIPFNEWLPRVLAAGNGWIEKGLFYGAEQCNRILRFEHNLGAQLNNCLHDCGIPMVELPHLAKTDHTHYRDYYNTESAVKLALYAFDEITEWGYSY